MTNKLSILLILLASTAAAQSGTSTTNVQDVTKSAKKWSLSLSSSLETDALQTDNVDKAYSNSTSLAVGYKLPKDFKLSASFTMDKDLTGLREETFRDPSISLSKKLPNIGKHTTTSGKISTKIPVSESSRKTTSLQTALSVSGMALFDASKYITKGLTIGYSAGLINNFHEFKVTTSGRSNTQRTLTNSLVFDYSINDQLGLYLDNTYYRNYTYDGRSNDYFSFDQSITYSHDIGVSLSLGHAIGGSALAINGRESNVKLFDNNDSTYYFTLAYSY